MKQLEAFFWGAVAALGSIVFQLVFFIAYSSFFDPFGKIAYSQYFTIPTFLIATAFIEELFKMLIIFRIITRDESGKYPIRAILLGLGFFGIELALILYGTQLPSTLELLEIAILHLGTSALMGYGLLKYGRNIFYASFLLILATLIHILYNYFTMNKTIYSSFSVIAILTLLVISAAWFFFSQRKTLAQD